MDRPTDTNSAEGNSLSYAECRLALLDAKSVGEMMHFWWDVLGIEVSSPQIVYTVQGEIVTMSVPCMGDQNSHHVPWEIGHCVPLDMLLLKQTSLIAGLTNFSIKVQIASILVFFQSFCLCFFYSILQLKFESKPQIICMWMNLPLCQ